MRSQEKSFYFRVNGILYSVFTATKALLRRFHTQVLCLCSHTMCLSCDIQVRQHCYKQLPFWYDMKCVEMYVEPLSHYGGALKGLPRRSKNCRTPRWAQYNRKQRRGSASSDQASDTIYLIEHLTWENVGARTVISHRTRQKVEERRLFCKCSGHKLEYGLNDRFW